MTLHPDQLGFDGLLRDAETENRARLFERETRHLPGTMAEAIPYYRRLIEQNHAAMLAADAEESHRLHKEARSLAVKLNGGGPGILADEDAPGYVLARATAAVDAMPPLWGQTGSFTITVASMAVQIDMQGMFGIGRGWGFWPGFAAHAIDPEAPFLSETGYRSFLGVHADPVPGLTPETFVAQMINAYVQKDLRGKLLPIGDQYREPPRSS